jgi:hypothetical protein
MRVSAFSNWILYDFSSIFKEEEIFNFENGWRAVKITVKEFVENEIILNKAKEFSMNSGKHLLDFTNEAYQLMMDY